MKNSKSNPFKPIVTIEQILLYKKESPETHTQSPFMNAVCDAFTELGLVNGIKMARYLQLSPRDFSSTVKVMTGIGYGELKLALEKVLFKKMKRENPKMYDKDILKQLGLTHRSTSWRLKHDINQGTYRPKRTHKQLINEIEEYFEKHKKISD